MLMFIFGFIAGAAVVAVGAFLVVRTAHNDAEKGQVYKPSNHAIIEKHELESYHRN